MNTITDEIKQAIRQILENSNYPGSVIDPITDIVSIYQLDEKNCFVLLNSDEPPIYSFMIVNISLRSYKILFTLDFDQIEDLSSILKLNVAHWHKIFHEWQQEADAMKVPCDGCKELYMPDQYRKLSKRENGYVIDVLKIIYEN